MYEDANAVCPYFRVVTKNRIRCEGMFPNSLTEVSFSRKNLSHKYKEKVCDTFAYGECPYAKMIDTKYEGH